jgi:hypothetical protein
MYVAAGIYEMIIWDKDFEADILVFMVILVLFEIFTSVDQYKYPNYRTIIFSHTMF